MSIDGDFYLKKKDKNMFFSIIFFFLSVILTLSLFFYNKILINDIHQISEESEKIQNLINIIKEDEKIQVKELLDINAKAFDDLKRKTQVLSFIYKIKEISSKYDIIFSAFNYGNGRISLDALVKTEEDGLPAHEKLNFFIEKYREDEQALFDLDFIQRFVGQNRISFHIDFLIK